jgi:hypothetical protein
LLVVAAVFFSRLYWGVSGFTVRFEQLACGLLFLAFLYDLRRKKLRLRFDPSTILVLALFPLMVLSSLLVCKFPLASLKKTLLYIPYLLAFAALVHYWADRDRLQAGWSFFYLAGTIALGISLAGYGLLFFGVNVGMVRVQEGSLWLRGTMVIPNILGSTAVLIFIAALARRTFRTGEGARTAGDTAALVIATACIMMSFTRMAWAGGLLGALAVLASSIKRVPLKRVAAVLALIAGTVALTYLATTRIKPRLALTADRETMGEFGDSTKDRYWSPESFGRIEYLDKIRGALGGESYSKAIRFRFRILKMAWQDWEKSPILGRGTDSMILERGGNPQNYISSAWMAILHDWGLLGLLAHGAFLVIAGVGLIRGAWMEPGTPWREFALTLLVVLFVSMMMYQSASTLQVAIFWVLLSFYAGAASVFSSPRPAEPARAGSMRS